MVRTVGDKSATAYQERIADAVAAAVRDGVSGAVMAPTGSGKSLMVAWAAADARAQGRPVLVVTPNATLATESVKNLRALPEFGGVRLNLLVAASERLGLEDVGDERVVLRGRRLDAGDAVVVATEAGLAETEAARGLDGYAAAFGASRGLVLGAGGLNVATVGVLRNMTGEAFESDVRRFVDAGGVVIVDEGQTAGAEQLSRVLAKLGDAGATCLQFSATPWREDGRDPLAPFKASLQDSVIAVATHAEVSAEGRVVPTRFKLANDVVAAGMRDAILGDVMEQIYEECVAKGQSAESASGEAFGRFFSEDAGEVDRARGAVLLGVIGDAWAVEAPAHGLAMLHCDRVDTALAVHGEIARREMPPGHPRAGLHARVATVTADSVSLHEGGRPVDLAERYGWRTPAARRRGVIDLARAGDLDVLVNVDALGVGLDVPRVDLNMIVAYKRNLSTLRQNEGRGARSSEGKLRQTFVDLGVSVRDHWRDLDALAKGHRDCVSESLLRVPAVCAREMHAWMASDPDLPAQVAEDLRRRPRRSGREDDLRLDSESGPKPEADPLTLPVLAEVAPGILAADCQPDRRSRDPSVAEFQGKIVASLACREPGPSGAVAVVVDAATGLTAGAYVASPSDAAAVGAFAGVTPRVRLDDDPDPADLRRIAAMAGAPDAAAWPPPDDAHEAGLQANLRTHMSRVRREALRVLGGKLFPDSPELDHPVRTMVLDRPDRMSSVRLGMTRWYLSTARDAGAPVDVLAVGPRSTLEARELLGGVAEVRGLASALGGGGRAAVAADVAAGLVAGWSPSPKVGREWTRRLVGMDPRTPAQTKIDVRLARALASLPFAEAAPAAGRLAGLDVEGLRMKELFSSGPRRSFHGEAAVRLVVGHLRPALVSVPRSHPATGEVVGADRLAAAPRGASAADDVVSSPRDRRLVLDRDVARRIVATLPSESVRSVVGALEAWAVVRETERHRSRAAPASSRTPEAVAPVPRPSGRGAAADGLPTELSALAGRGSRNLRILATRAELTGASGSDVAAVVRLLTPAVSQPEYDRHFNRTGTFSKGAEGLSHLVKGFGTARPGAMRGLVVDLEAATPLVSRLAAGDRALLTRTLPELSSRLRVDEERRRERAKREAGAKPQRWWSR